MMRDVMRGILSDDARDDVGDVFARRLWRGSGLDRLRFRRVGSQNHQELEGADGESVAVFQFLFDADSLAVDVDAVFTSQIAYGNVRRLGQNRAMITTYELAFGLKLAIFSASDHELRNRDRDRQSRTRTANNLEF